MMSMVESLSLVVAPVLAVALLAEVGLRGILMADLGSCAVALTTVLLTPLPARPVETGRRGWIWWSAGVRYILQRAPLRRLQVVFTLSNFTSGLTGGVLLAYLLLRCDGDTEAVAWVSALSAGGGIAGGAVRALLPARGNQVLRILLGLAAAGLVGRVVLPVLGTPLLLGLALGARSLLIGLVNAANDAVWVSEVPVELQGRVFGARRFCAQGLYPLAVLLGGAIGDAPRLAAALGALPWLTGAGSSPQLIVLSVLFAVAGLLECAAPLCLLRPAALPRLEAVVAPVAMRAGAAGQSTRRREA
jgi:DHA3 family macrolide efflux protein-like MFS transporter